MKKDKLLCHSTRTKR